MVFALFRMPYNLLTSLIPVIRYILLCIQQALTVLFFLVLLVLFINISKNLVAFVSKAGAKVRTLKHNFQMFRKFFFIFLFQGRSSERNLWQRREKWKLTAPFYCQNVKTSPPSFPKADAKVALLRTSAKYIQAFFEGLRELFHN